MPTVIMSEAQFTTPDGHTVHYYFEELTLRSIRFWQEFRLEHCEAWLADAEGTEQCWRYPPLWVQGRRGHRYRLCWARASSAATYSLVAACNLSTKKHALSTSKGLVASLFAPAKFGRRAFWIALGFVIVASLASHFDLGELRRSVWSGIAWWHLLAAPFVVGLVGRGASIWRDARDVDRSFERLIEAQLFFNR